MQNFWLVEDDRSKVVSALTQIEACSAICRLRKEGRMTLDEEFAVLDSIATEVKRIIEQPITPPVLAAASIVIRRHYLRALDAVQLGGAIVSRELLAVPDMRFVASDEKLLEAAQKEGFGIWNPLD